MCAECNHLIKKKKNPKQKTQRFEGVALSRQLDGDSGVAVVDLDVRCIYGLADWQEVVVMS